MAAFSPRCLVTRLFLCGKNAFFILRPTTTYTMPSPVRCAYVTNVITRDEPHREGVLLCIISLLFPGPHTSTSRAVPHTHTNNQLRHTAQERKEEQAPFIRTQQTRGCLLPHPRTPHINSPYPRVSLSTTEYTRQACHVVAPSIAHNVNVCGRL